MPFIKGNCQTSTIINSEKLQELISSLNTFYSSCPWELTYRKSLHGSSLTTLHKKNSVRTTGNITLVRTKANLVFGLFASTNWDKDNQFKYYGNGESLLFKWCCPLLHDLRIYKWNNMSKDKEHLLCTTSEGLSVGVLENPALMIEVNISEGISYPSDIFNNPSLHANECSQDANDDSEFKISDLEIWCNSSSYIN